MILKELLASTPIFEVVGLRRIDITGIAVRAKDVKKGYMFVYSYKKAEMPYEDAVSEAVKRGALAICIGKEQEMLKYPVTYIKTYHINRFLSAVAKNFYQNPSQNMDLVGITGSHGKTTVGWMIKSILEATDTECVSMGMAGYQMADELCKEYSNDFGSLMIHSRLKKAVDKNIKWGIIECSYTGIVEEVMRHIRFDSLIYTDLYTYFQNQRSDYHYFEIRKNLLDYLKLSTSPIIINMDDFYAHELKRSNTVSYGLFNKSDIYAENIRLTKNGSAFTLVTPKGSWDITLKVPGIHNIYNAMAACAWGFSEGLTWEIIETGLESFDETFFDDQSKPLPGDIKIAISTSADLSKLKSTYEDLKSTTKGKIVSVLLVGDAKTIEEYKQLGKLSSEYCSTMIITSDYYHPHKTMDTAFAIAQGHQDAIISHEADNFKALLKAVQSSQDGDTVLLVV